ESGTAAPDLSKKAPAALRASAAENDDVPMTFSGPSEGGGTEIHSEDEELADPAVESASRRERRAAARANAKSSRPKPPKSRKKR
ncbi:hypothetical protein, partial [Gordonia sp. NPDC003585]